jgi:hypothetical protein
MSIYLVFFAANCAFPQSGADMLPGALGFLQNQPAVTQSTSAVAIITEKIPAVELPFEETPDSENQIENDEKGDEEVDENDKKDEEVDENDEKDEEVDEKDEEVDENDKKDEEVDENDKKDEVVNENDKKDETPSPESNAPDHVEREKIEDWMTCDPSFVNPCKSENFSCCLGALDVAENKYTCRAEGYCLQLRYRYKK